MKKLFIVSNDRNIWISDNKDLVISDPYIFNEIKKNNELNNFSSVKVCKYTRKSKKDLLHDSNYVDKKYDKYLPIFVSRLNKINNKNYSVKFWKKALSLGLIRYITLFHDVYQNIETNFNKKTHICNILSESSYFTPLDFEEHRSCFEYTDFGIEQISSIFFNLFYNESFNKIEEDFVLPTTNKKSIYTKFYDKLLSIKSFSINDLFIKLKLKYIDKINVDKSNISILIFGSFFSDNYYYELEKKSNKKIYRLKNQNENKPLKTKLRLDKREILAKCNDDFDDFDKFFFKSVKYCFPQCFVENFSKIENSYNLKFNKFNNLKYIISEAWISDSYISIYLAFIQNKGVIHITNEHNSLFHPFSGSFISHVINMSDLFVSLGWFNSKHTNMIKGGSLFPFVIDKEHTNNIKILYISGSLFNRLSHYNSLYLTGGEGSLKNVKYVSDFFDSLNNNIVNTITYRPYPNNPQGNLSFDKEFLLKKQLKNIKNFANTKIPCKVQMTNSSLIIIDYVSTAWLEALYMNIPIIILWNSETISLKDEYADFFDSLIRVGVCQVEPAKAALFVGKIHNNPKKWWFSESVQAARKEFMDTNLGKPKTMMNYLLGLINKQE